MSVNSERYPEVGEEVLFRGVRHLIINTVGTQIWIADTTVAEHGILGDFQIFIWSEKEGAWVVRPKN
jgi:hypothetical protein